MYIVTIQNGTEAPVEIHNEHHKLLSGNIVQGINTIDSFTFSCLPNNPAFGNLHDFTTLVNVYNLAKRRYEFFGRVLCTSPQMDESGLITLEATCESYLGFLCDSRQTYVEPKNWSAYGLLAHIIAEHNSQMEEYKHFHIGDFDVVHEGYNLYEGIQRENTFDTIKKHLLDKLGGEIRFRVVDGKIYLDYYKQIGETKSTEIALSRNMKAITKEKDPSAFITRLIPLGAKKGDDTEERYDITEVNGGKNYIDDAEAIAKYGLHVGYVEFDDVTEPSGVLLRGQKWIKENNKVLIKYAITALDLSLIGLDADDFTVYNTHPVKNKLLGIDDTARIIRKNIDVVDEVDTSFEVGDNFKTLSELQREQTASIGKVTESVAEIIRNYVPNQVFTAEMNRTISLIEQTEGRVLLSVAELRDRNLIRDSKTPVTLSATAAQNYVYKRFDPTIPLKHGKTYSFGADVTVHSNVTDGKIVIGIFNDQLNTASDLATLDIVGDYDKENLTYPYSGHISGTITIDKVSEPACLLVYAGKNGETASNSITLSNIKFEEGGTPNAWTPAPEDLALRAELALEIKTDANGKKYSQLSAEANKIVFNSDEIEINTDNFSLLDGKLTCIEEEESTGKQTKIILDATGVTSYEKDANEWKPTKRIKWSKIVTFTGSDSWSGGVWS